MHIPDMMLQGAICPATAGLAAVGLASVGYAAYKTAAKPTAAFFASVTALIFAAQMADFPIPLGTSGHLIGATLAVALLGSAFGIIAMSLVVITQCLVFADGGISVLGANLLNLALIAALPAVIIREYFSATSFKHTAYFAAAFISTIAAAAACAVQLAIAGVVPIQSVLPAMFSAHALLGLAEGGLTVAALVVLSYATTKLGTARAWMLPLGIAVAIPVIISPFVVMLPVTSPIGLEWVAGELGFAHLAATFFAAPFAEYAVPFVPEIFSTALAGIIGIALIFASAYGMRQVLTQR